MRKTTKSVKIDKVETKYPDSKYPTKPVKKAIKKGKK